MGLQEALNAAFDGRIDSLFIECERPNWGCYDEQSRNLQIHLEQQAGDIDLVKEAIYRTFSQGGEVYALEKVVAPKPAQERALALLRY